MTFSLDFKSGRPVYLQLVEQVRYAAASGALQPGEPLPAIRALAEQLRINRNTVFRAYAELESLGLVATQPGRGTFLTESSSGLTKRMRDKALAARIDEAIVTAHQLKIEREAFLALVTERLDLFERPNASTLNT